MVWRSGAVQIPFGLMGRHFQTDGLWRLGNEEIASLFSGFKGKNPLDGVDWSWFVVSSHEGKIFSKNIYDSVGQEISEIG